MTREEALEKLKKPAYDPETIDDEFNYIATKLGITPDELRKYFKCLKSFIGIIKISKTYSDWSKSIKYSGC